ncbi:hypothetical protein BH739_16350 [Enterococcus casseliflavus]|nr:hypothetical protein BH739_16350 [Enterococcus casseliflavus]
MLYIKRQGMSEVQNFKILEFDSRDEMAQLAAKDIEEAIKNVLNEKDEVRMIFACAPSQVEVLNYLVTKDVEWEKVVAFHMDEYEGLQDKSKSFGHFIEVYLADKVDLKQMNYIGHSKESYKKFEDSLVSSPIDIVVMGVGENGHIAFNEPEYADFNDKEILKEVILDNTCRMQQVHDKCFDKFEDVPEKAMTLTVPVLTGCDNTFVIVPGETKREILKKLVDAPITEELPASILKTKDNVKFYTDQKVY